MEEYPVLHRFFNEYISNQTYIQHNSVEGNISITLTSIFNYNSLLDVEAQKLIQDNYMNSYRYFDDINSEKAKKLKELMKQNEQVKSFPLKDKAEDSNEQNILAFNFPIFEIYFVAKLYTGNMFIEPEIQTEINYSQNMKEKITFRYAYKDITTDSYIILSIYSNQLPKDKNLLGTTMINLFDEKNNLVQGRHVLKIKPSIDIKDPARDSLNTSEINDKELDYLVFTYFKERRNNKIKKYTKIPNSKEGIEQMTQDEVINSYYIDEEKGTIELKDDDMINYQTKLHFLLSQTNNSYLEIDFCSFNSPILYEEKQSASYNKCYKYDRVDENCNKVNSWICDPQVHRGKNKKDFFLKNNPITEQFNILSSVSDEDFRDLKPSPYEIEQINKLLTTPDFIPLDDQGAITFWRFRYALLKQDKKYALPKILNSVKWDQEKAVHDFVKNILAQWKTVEVCDILYMLSRKFNINPNLNKKEGDNGTEEKVVIYPGFKEVRRFAVSRLKKIPSDDINFILLQLVQALKYEDEKNPFLRDMLLEKCAESAELATSFYWFITVETGEGDKSKKDPEERTEMEKVYKSIQEKFKKSLARNENIEKNVLSQIKLKDTLLTISKEMSKVPGKSDLKKAKFKSLIERKTETGQALYEEHFVPLNAQIKINGIQADKCTVFRSAMFPVKYSFVVENEYQKNNKEKEDPSHFETMFKYGDDLRQDQLILQIINYMNKLLLNAGQDYEFTTYKVLATSKSDGFVEFVSNSKTIYDISKEFKSNCIRGYIEQCANNDSVEIEKRLESFVNSCAGYCVVTYLLGIGDRHLENILVDRKGKLFHIDFGYIFGKDPKPFPPSMKISPEMIKCMDDKGSKRFEEFKNKCINAFWVLRENARLIVNMLYLMLDSGIPELNNQEALEKMHEKFLQQQSKQDAANSLLTIIEESTGSIYSLLDTAHNLAVKWKG